MSTVEEFIKLKNETTFQRITPKTITGPDERRSTLAFISEEGDILFLEDRAYIKKEEALRFAHWIMNVYEDPLEFKPGGVIQCEEEMTMSIDDQPMMKEVRDKHFPKIPVEGGGV